MWQMRSIPADRYPLGLITTEQLVSSVYAPHLLRQNSVGATKISNVNFVSDVNVDSAKIELGRCCVIDLSFEFLPLSFDYSCIV